MGFTALRQMGRAVGIDVDHDPDPDTQTQLTFEEFETAVQRLNDVGFEVERTAEEAWPHFRGWRVNYEGVALALARATNAPPALWSGPRRWPSTPIPPSRPQNRRPSDAEPTARGAAYDRIAARGRVAIPKLDGPGEAAAPDHRDAAG
jgi:hypothetical protein